MAACTASATLANSARRPSPRFYDSAGPSADDRIYNIIAQMLEAVQRAVFVTADELRKAYNVGYHDHRQPAADIFRCHRNL
jgi:hypothetical protein